MQIKTIVKCCFSPMGLPKILKFDKILCRSDYGINSHFSTLPMTVKTGTSWKENDLAGSSPTALPLPFDPASLLGIDLKDILKIYYIKRIYTRNLFHSFLEPQSKDQSPIGEHLCHLQSFVFPGDKVNAEGTSCDVLL